MTRLGLMVMIPLFFGCSGKTGNAQSAPAVITTITQGSSSRPDSTLQPQVSVGLIDGTKLIGRLARRVFTIQTPYMKSDIPVGLLASLERESPGAPFTMNFSNGDRIRGTLSVDSLEMETLLGYVSIPIRNVASISFLPGAPGPAEGLVAFYPLKGNADDVSGRRNNGVPHGPSPAADHRGLSNGAYLFNGSRTYVQIPDVLFAPAVSGFTVSAWVLANDIGSRGMAVYTGTRMGECMLQVDHGNFYFLAKFVDGDWYMASSPATRGKYVFLTGVYQRGRSLQLWINGERMSEAPVPDLDLYGGPPAASAAIGAYWPESLNFVWRGAIEDVRIYNRALNESEIRSLYAAEK